MPTYVERFSGLARLYGEEGLNRLRQSHVMVVGLGGVGSWAVEALARSGVGKMTLVDLDDICSTNVNRQIHALTESIGKPKVMELKQRIQSINPLIEVDAVYDFLTTENVEEILNKGPHFVLDAIDSLKNKCLLIASCKERSIPILTVGGAGGRKDPGRISISDLSKSYNDFLLARVRKKLRQDYAFPRGKKEHYGIDSVFSSELPVYPDGTGGICHTKAEAANLKLDCQTGYGTTTFITGTFGFFAASYIVNKLVEANHTANT